MPCYSTIQKTKLSDGVKLADALREIGYTVVVRGDVISGTNGRKQIVFQKSGNVYAVSGDTQDLISIQRKYAEIGIRQWSRQRGYGIQSNNGKKIVLVNRRG